MTEQCKENATKIATFEFKKGDEFKTADQIIDGMMHFELIGYANDTHLELEILKDFSIGWLEKEEDNEKV
jgi:hypothetical protein